VEEDYDEYIKLCAGKLDVLPVDMLKWDQYVAGHMQKKLMDAVHEEAWAKFFQKLDSFDRVRILEACGKISRSWLQALPTARPLVLNDATVRYGLRRLLMDGFLEIVSPSKTCVCNKTDSAYHHMACQNNGYLRTYRHTYVCKALAHGLASSTSLKVRREVTVASQVRADMLVTSADGSLNQALDVAVVVIKPLDVKTYPMVYRHSPIFNNDNGVSTPDRQLQADERQQVADMERVAMEYDLGDRDNPWLASSQEAGPSVPQAASVRVGVAGQPISGLVYSGIASDPDAAADVDANNVEAAEEADDVDLNVPGTAADADDDDDDDDNGGGRRSRQTRGMECPIVKVVRNYRAQCWTHVIGKSLAAEEKSKLHHYRDISPTIEFCPIVMSATGNVSQKAIKWFKTFGSEAREPGQDRYQALRFTYAHISCLLLKFSADMANNMMKR
jgi:hypothetical protein